MDHEALTEPLEAAGVAVAWLFGSRATGRARPDSDTDLAVLAARDRSPLGLLELSALEGELAQAVGGPVDVVDFARAPLELQGRIVLEGQCVYSTDEPLRVRTVVETQSRWEDVRRALAEMDRAYLTAVAER